MTKLKAKVDLIVKENAAAFNAFSELLNEVMDDCNNLNKKVAELRELSTRLVDITTEVTADNDSHE